jgi:hypothetical protein
MTDSESTHESHPPGNASQSPEPRDPGLRKGAEEQALESERTHLAGLIGRLIALQWIGGRTLRGHR